MDQRTITYRTKARASHYYGVYPDAVMRLERYGRDGILASERSERARVSRARD
ncbi:hypothetical protein Hlac_2680 [Halorubrum lacusprofundi ATCC 49239]|jgi:hypothetical protein|uniref:Uncharacterized protein n=1 Tax=Halorubrum lacusprofundi (strain ATCC 49239 / DSM 5036 / JCM 8891 / ACAM 34) TaxID=416348 RepID=B9LU57_HALLT|nr:hypothetical protein Hlac_2680 [Halorubrum lacusprofundi ATCC 49239]